MTYKQMSSAVKMAGSFLLSLFTQSSESFLLCVQTLLMSFVWPLLYFQTDQAVKKSGPDFLIYFLKYFFFAQQWSELSDREVVPSFAVVPPLGKAAPVDD